MAFRMKMQEQIYHGMNDHKMYYDEKISGRSWYAPASCPATSGRRIKFWCSLHIVAKKAA